MASQLTGEMLDVLMPTASWRELGRTLHERYEGVAQGICLLLPVDPANDAALGRVVRELQE